MTEKAIQDVGQYGPFDPKYFQERDVVADLMAGEKADLRERIEKLESWLKDRQRIMYDNLERTDLNISRADHEMYWIRTSNCYDGRRISGLERTMFDLEQQKCRERSGCFKDCWLVERELMELMKQEQELRRRDLILK